MDKLPTDTGKGGRKGLLLLVVAEENKKYKHMYTKYRTDFTPPPPLTYPHIDSQGKKGERKKKEGIKERN